MPGRTTPNSQALLILACSGTKLPHPAPALELYRGVMYSTFRANVKPQAAPTVVILSAMHGFISSDAVIEPYELRLTEDRAQAMRYHLDAHLHLPPQGEVKQVLLAGGRTYRELMRAALPRLIAGGARDPGLEVLETTGGLGYQRQQLRAFLAQLSPQESIVGHHPNGRPLYGRLGAFSVGTAAKLTYRSRPGTSQAVVITELFEGPKGPTAAVLVTDELRPDHRQSRWVDLEDLQAEGG